MRDAILTFLVLAIFWAVVIFLPPHDDAARDAQWVKHSRWFR